MECWCLSNEIYKKQALSIQLNEKCSTNMFSHFATQIVRSHIFQTKPWARHSSFFFLVESKTDVNNGKFVTVIKHRWLFMEEQGLVCFFFIVQGNKDRIIFNKKKKKHCLKIKSRLLSFICRTKVMRISHVIQSKMTIILPNLTLLRINAQYLRIELQERKKKTPQHRFKIQIGNVNQMCVQRKIKCKK